MMKKYIISFLGVTAIGGAIGFADPASAVSLVEVTGSVPGTFKDNKSFEARWIAGASDLTPGRVSEVRIGADPGTTPRGDSQVDWVKDSPLNWTLTYAPSLAKTTLSLPQYNGQPIQADISYDSPLEVSPSNYTLLDRFRITLQAQDPANSFMASTTSIALTIASVKVNGNNTNILGAPISDIVSLGGTSFLDRYFQLDGIGNTITEIQGTATLSWLSIDPQTANGGANERLRVRLFGYNSAPPAPNNASLLLPKEELIVTPKQDSPVGTPEPSLLLGLLAVGAFGAAGRRKA